MLTPEEIAQKTKTDYAWIADEAVRLGVEEWRGQICRPIFDPVQAQYVLAPGYVEEANLGLGCAIPPLLAPISVGNRVIDLGCASGIDSFISAYLVGNSGEVVGIDLTPALIERAKGIAQRKGIGNVHFQVADIASLPFEGQNFDIATSNGVWSLIPDKLKAMQEVLRVLKPGGTFLLADLVCRESLESELHDTLMGFTGCFNGIFPLHTYEKWLLEAGFSSLERVNLRPVIVPADILPSDWSESEVQQFNQNGLMAAAILARKA